MDTLILRVRAPATADRMTVPGCGANGLLSNSLSTALTVPLDGMTLQAFLQAKHPPQMGIERGDQREGIIEGIDGIALER